LLPIASGVGQGRLKLLSQEQYMDFKTVEILQLVGTIWEATLNIPIETEWACAAVGASRTTAACIHLTGAWSGAVLLDCPAEVARHAASVMFGAEPGAVSTSDLQDAVAELANMIGGNIKGLLPEKCYLSLPAAVEGGDYSARIPGSRVAGHITFGSSGHTVTITIFEKLEWEAAAA